MRAIKFKAKYYSSDLIIKVIKTENEYQSRYSITKFDSDHDRCDDSNGKIIRNDDSNNRITLIQIKLSRKSLNNFPGRNYRAVSPGGKNL